MGIKVEYIEPGIDPTEEEYTMDGPSCSGCLTLGVALFAVVAIGLLIVSVATARPASKPATPTEISSPTVTQTPLPTSTGTVTPQPPTATPQPSETSTFIPPPTAEKQKRVITATSFVTPPSVMTATEITDRRAYSTPTPKTFLQQRKEYIAAATATARAIRLKPTETPAG